MVGLLFCLSFMADRGPSISARSPRGAKRNAQCAMPDCARSAGPRSSFHPVLHPQASHALELALIVGHKREPGCLRMGGNPQIVVSDRLALCFESRSDRAVGMTGFRGQGMT